MENSFTLGSEFYLQSFVEVVDKIKRSETPYKTLKEVCKVITDGDHGKTQYTNSGVLYLLSESIKSGYIDTSVGTRFISEEYNKSLKRSELTARDIVVTKTGIYFGHSAVIPDNIKIANTSAHVAKITLTKGINPYYFSTFINSSIGYSQLRRRGMKVSRPEIKLLEFQDILISLPNIYFQNLIEKIIKKSQEKRLKSELSYTEASEQLLQQLGLSDLKLTEDNISIRTAKESIFSLDRLDAEYYQPKYDQIEAKLQLSDFTTLSNELLWIRTGEYSSEYRQKSESNDLTFYIRSINIKDGIVKEDESYYVPKKDFTRVASTGDIVTARVGSVGIFGEVTEGISGSVYSDNILCFRLPDSFIPSVYTLLFNSQFYYELIGRLARGSVQQRLNQETLKELIIPIIPLDKQLLIKRKIDEKYLLLNESKNLLSVAKKAVELAIEENEKYALHYIMENTNLEIEECQN